MCVQIELTELQLLVIPLDVTSDEGVCSCSVPEITPRDLVFLDQIDANDNSAFDETSINSTVVIC